MQVWVLRDWSLETFWEFIYTKDFYDLLGRAYVHRILRRGRSFQKKRRIVVYTFCLITGQNENETEFSDNNI